MARLLAAFRLSPLIETSPVGPGTDGQPLYLNAVGVGETTLAAPALLARLHEIEAAAGRTRTSLNAARTLDLDLILLGDEILRTGEVWVPHPRFRERKFVLGPLVMVAPDLRDPETGLTMGELLARLPD